MNRNDMFDFFVSPFLTLLGITFITLMLGGLVITGLAFTGHSVDPSALRDNSALLVLGSISVVTGGLALLIAGAAAMASCATLAQED